MIARNNLVDFGGDGIIIEPGSLHDTLVVRANRFFAANGDGLVAALQVLATVVTTAMAVMAISSGPCVTVVGRVT